MRHAEMLLAGHVWGGPCDQAVGKVVVRNPYDGSVVGTAAEGGWQEANTALNAAAEVFPSYRTTAIAWRQERLLRVADAIRARTEELAQLLVEEIGKPISLARGEVERTRLTFQLAAHALSDWGDLPIDVSTDARGENFSVTARQEPLGPVLGIVPYNWPLNLAAHKIAPALAVGCPVILKVSPKAPLSSLTLARILFESGFESEAFQALNVPNPIAEKMALDPRIAKVSFTGSAEIGWRLKEKLPRKPVTLELGGDAFAVVCVDSDIEDAANKLAISAFGYSGQVCISTQHILVSRQIYASFRQAFLEATKRIIVGNPADEDVLCGPLIDGEARDRVLNWIIEAESAGAKRLFGGEIHGNVVSSCILENVPRDVRLGCKEVFGPVVTLAAIEDLGEALARIRESQYGLQSAIFSNNDEMVADFADQLDVGGIVINHAPSIRFDAMPYGGQKASGWGREGVSYAMASCCAWKSIVRFKRGRK